MTVLVGTLIGTVLALDAAFDALAVNVVTTGLVDEPAHLATAALGLLALSTRFPTPKRRASTWSALIASVAIDLDHLPLYAGVSGIAHGGRPYTHSLLTVALVLLAGLTFRRLRTVLLGVALGCALHLLRDVATGPGIPLLWPITDASVRVPYWIYFCFLLLFATIAVLREFEDRPLTPPESSAKCCSRF